MLDNSPFQKATQEQVNGGDCPICQMPLSSGTTSTAAEPPASFSFRSVVFVSGCDKPHFMHTDCALDLVESEKDNNLRCPVCQYPIEKIEASRLFLKSLKKEDDQLKREEEQLKECRRFHRELRDTLDQVATSGISSMLPQLISLTKQASSIPEKSDELTACLKEARWTLGKAFLERAQKSHMLIEINDAIMHFKDCLRMSGDENKSEIQECLEQATLLRLDNFLDSARNNPRVANNKLWLLKDEKLNLDESSPAVKLKYGELLFIKSQERYPNPNESGSDIQLDLKKALEYGFSDAAPLLGKSYLKDARKYSNDALNNFFTSPESILNDIDLSIRHGAPKTKQQAEKLKGALPEKFLEQVQKTIKSVNLEDETQVKNALKTLEYAARHGTSKTKADAEALLQKKEEWISDNQKLPKTKGAR